MLGRVVTYGDVFKKNYSYIAYVEMYIEVNCFTN